MYRIGEYNTLPVLRRSPMGLHLGSREDHILLPAEEAPDDIGRGDTIEVFVYTDSNDYPAATLREPRGTVGQFVPLEIIDESGHGVFADWGLEKDLLIPWNSQHEPLNVGDRVVVRIHLDPQGRVIGSSKLSRFFDDFVGDRLRPGDPVHVMVYGRHRLGHFVIVNGRYNGMAYRNETFSDLDLGDQRKAWVKAIRPDGKIDVTLQRRGSAGREDAAETLARAIRRAGDFLPIHDKSDPELIKRELGMSKKAFKRAAGLLYREGAIEITPEGLRWRH